MRGRLTSFFVLRGPSSDGSFPASKRKFNGLLFAYSAKPDNPLMVNYCPQIPWPKRRLRLRETRLTPPLLSDYVPTHLAHQPTKYIPIPLLQRGYVEPEP